MLTERECITLQATYRMHTVIRQSAVRLSKRATSGEVQWSCSEPGGKGSNRLCYRKTFSVAVNISYRIYKAYAP